MASRVLAFLRDESNRALLGWIGGGLAVAAGGLWAVYVHFYPAPEAKPPPVQKQIEADCGSVAIGGDVSGAKITAGTSGDCPKPRPAGPVARVEDRPSVHAEQGSVAIFAMSRTARSQLAYPRKSSANLSA